MIVRHFLPKDKELFFGLCKEFYEAEATLRAYDEKITERTFERVLDHHENSWGYMMYDKEDGENVGYALLTSYWSNEDGGNVIVLDELYIAPNNRNKGYGKIFMQWIEDAFKNDAVSITLEVLTTNIRACELYSKIGYKPDGFITYTKSIKKE